MEMPTEIPANQGFIQIQSTELLYLRNEVAGIGSRAYAYSIDLTIKLIAAAIAGFTIYISRYAFNGREMLIFFIAFAVIFAGYHVVFESLWAGRTPGKIAAGIRVFKADGSAPTVLDIVIRNTLRIVDIFPYGYCTGMLVMFFERYNRRIGDLVADTVVIYDRHSRKNIKDFILSRRTEPTARPTIIIQGLEKLTENEKQIIRSIYERRESMGMEEKLDILIKLREKIFSRMTIQGTNDPEVMLCELYKRI
jgi:uncharacterized RDD family membrane protein YckC